MSEYHKIDSIYKRDERGKFIIGEFSRPEFEYLKDLPWQWTEKVDGTNIRITWGDGLPFRYGGKTDNAQLPVKLLTHLQALVEDKRKHFSEMFGATESVILYGEGYGAGIQKGGGNYSLDPQFVLFDVKIGTWWLTRDSIIDIATKLDLRVVPLFGEMTIPQAIEFVAAGFRSQWGDFPAEGLVGTPVVPLFARNGDRIITKVKIRDFK